MDRAAHDLGNIGPMPDRIAVAQELLVEVSVDLQVGVARGAVQKPAPDARRADLLDAAVEAFSGFRRDRGIHPFVGTKREAVEVVCVQGMAGLSESSTSRLIHAADDRKTLNRFYLAAVGRQKCRQPTFNHRGESRSRPYFPSSSFGT